MMTHLSAVAVVAATATLVGQASSADYMPPADPTSTGGGEEEAAVYLGCFHDNKDDRVLGDKLSSADMTTKVCLDYCMELGATFMATQWSFECWCSVDGGLDYNRHYEMMGEDAVCDMACMGDETEMCGGYDSFDLYTLGPTAEECSSPAAAYDQCGGSSWTGSACCSEGYECVAMGKGECYSQCRPVSVDETTPPPTTTEEPTPAATEEPTPAATEEPTPAATEEPTPAATEEPTPAATEEPTPAATKEPTPAATEEPTPAATEEPTPAATEEPTPAATEEPTPITPEPVAPTPKPATPEPVAPPVADPTPEPAPPADGCKVVIIEGEDLALTGAWKVKSDPAASGGQYVVWEGLSDARNNQSPDDGDIISTAIDIPTAGTYSFQWRMRQPANVEDDKGNDSWLYFPDATRFGPKNKSSSYGTFVKVYGRAHNGVFVYSGTAEDKNHKHSVIAVEFATAGKYTMEIAGRSHGHQIDQIILYGQGMSVENAAGGC